MAKEGNLLKKTNNIVSVDSPVLHIFCFALRFNTMYLFQDSRNKYRSISINSSWQFLCLIFCFGNHFFLPLVPGIKEHADGCIYGFFLKAPFD